MVYLNVRGISSKIFNVVWTLGFAISTSEVLRSKNAPNATLMGLRATPHCPRCSFGPFDWISAGRFTAQKGRWNEGKQERRRKG